VEASSRKLIRPSLIEHKEKADVKRTPPPPAKSAAAGAGAAAAATPPAQQQHHHPPQQQQGGPPKNSPPEQTNAENFYYAKQIQMKTPMVLVLRDGEAVTGTLEWYDKHCFRLAREKAPAVLIYKSNVKYMYKAE
jgi:sRNA-binding regulator protein Hfq